MIDEQAIEREQQMIDAFKMLDSDMQNRFIGRAQGISDAEQALELDKQHQNAET